MTLIHADALPEEPVFVHTLGVNSLGSQYEGLSATVPVSAAYSTTDRIYTTPFILTKPYNLARWWWLNGATVGTNYVQNAIYNENFELVAASPRTLQAGTASQVQYANPGIHGTNITNDDSATDATSYATASVTLKAGVLYLIGVTNTKASAADTISSISGGGTWTSRSSVAWDASTAKRTSIWSCVPTADYTGTITIDFGANTQTGCGWSVNAFYHVDTATNDGIVQNATGSGTAGTTLTATLAAFGSANNGVFASYAIDTVNVFAPESASYIELTDNAQNGAAPTFQHGAEFRPDNDTSVTATTGVASDWGICAVEIKSKGTGAIWIPPMRGHLAFHCNGTTATFFRKVSWTEIGGVYLASAPTGFPGVLTPAATAGLPYLVVHGFTRRATV